jgi:hypothetical protein
MQLFVFVLLFAFAHAFFSTLDQGVPLALFSDTLVGTNTCTFIFTSLNVYVVNGSDIQGAAVTSIDNLILNPVSSAAVGAVAMFRDLSGKGVVVAVADSSGTIGFASLSDCFSTFSVQPDWGFEVPSMNWTAAFRVSSSAGAETFLFANDKKDTLAYVGWIESTGGRILGLVSKGKVKFPAALQNMTLRAAASFGGNQVIFASERVFDVYQTVETVVLTRDSSNSFVAVGRIRGDEDRPDTINSVSSFDGGNMAGMFGYRKLFLLFFPRIGFPQLLNVTFLLKKKKQFLLCLLLSPQVSERFVWKYDTVCCNNAIYRLIQCELYFGQSGRRKIFLGC